jgi:hypothetical protein
LFTHLQTSITCVVKFAQILSFTQIGGKVWT